MSNSKWNKLAAGLVKDLSLHSRTCWMVEGNPLPREDLVGVEDLGGSMSMKGSLTEKDVKAFFWDKRKELAAQPAPLVWAFYDPSRHLSVIGLGRLVPKEGDSWDSSSPHSQPSAASQPSPASPTGSTPGDPTSSEPTPSDEPTTSSD